LKDRNVVEDEIYFYLNGLFCPYCGMQLRSTPTIKDGEERIRQRRSHQGLIDKLRIIRQNYWMTQIFLLTRNGQQQN